MDARAQEIWAATYRYRIISLWRHGDRADVAVLYGSTADSGRGVADAVQRWGLHQALLTLSGLAPRERWYRGLTFAEAMRRVEKTRTDAHAAGFRRLTGPRSDPQ